MLVTGADAGQPCSVVFWTKYGESDRCNRIARQLDDSEAATVRRYSGCLEEVVC
jgi:hypothetical protein